MLTPSASDLVDYWRLEACKLLHKTSESSARRAAALTEVRFHTGCWEAGSFSAPILAYTYFKGCCLLGGPVV
jgi:hypothetical protein